MPVCRLTFHRQRRTLGFMKAESPIMERLERTWSELDGLVKRLHRGGPAGLSAEELGRLDKLYRVSTIQLAQARSRACDPALLRDLNRLVARAHSAVYSPPRGRYVRRIVSFYGTGFARVVARTARFHALALVLFLAGCACGYAVTLQRPLAAYVFSPMLAGRLPGASAEQLQEVLRAGRDQDDNTKLAFASFLFTHNTRVGMAAFAVGVLAGIPTVLLVLYNGAMMGAFLAIHHQKGIISEVHAWLLPHGVTEIGAILLCGGAGLMLGRAVVRPGFQLRGERLKRAGEEALLLVLGVVPMFMAAGFIESFVRQSTLETSERLLFAGGTALFWFLYFLNGYYLERRDALAAVQSGPPTTDSTL